MNLIKNNISNTQLNDCLNDLKIKRREARREYKSHFLTAGRYRRLHSTLGSLSVSCGVIAGSGFLVEIQALNNLFNIIASFLTLSAACLTGLITFNRYLEKANIHERAGYKWERYRDDCQLLILKLTAKLERDQFPAMLKEYENICNRRNEIRNSTITVPLSVFWKHEHLKDKAELKI